METLRLGIVGAGNMGYDHAKKVFDGAVKNLKLVAVCDIDEAKRKRLTDTFGDAIEIYDDHHKMLDAHTVDIILIAVPHYLHPVIAIEAFEKGYHVLTEKPAGVYTSAVRAMNEAAKKSGKVFGIMFNQRTNPLYKKAHDIMKSGELGTPKRMIWVITNWFRTQSYYDSGAWRATWGGEGGGVLLNQSPHQLDLWQWIFGMPSKIRAFCNVAKYHDVEIEDEATIFAEYDNGATATFITTTGEFPGSNRTEISATKGKMVIEGNKLKIWRLEQEDCVVSKTATEGFAEIPYTYEEITSENEGTAHMGVLQNFVDHILTGSEMLAPGIDGLCELTISNAAYLSSWTGNSLITLPLDEKLYEAELKKRIEASDKKFSYTSECDENCAGRWKINW